MPTKTNSRRDFIKKSASVSLGIITVPKIITSCVKGANDKVNIGMVGTGEHGTLRNMKNYFKIDDCRIVALCDVDSARLDYAKDLTYKCYNDKHVKLFDDFRELLERKDIDAIQISTPDHWHVYQTIASLKAGKHVCCEKPTLTIEQGQIQREQLKKTNKLYQTSLEDRFLEPYYRMAKLVREGRIGKLKKMRVGLPGQCSLRKSKDFTVQPVPKHFNYDMWLGPAPDAPYFPARCHYSFRWFSDYSGGNLTDWGAHLIDTAQLCNKAEQSGPVEVEGKGTLPENGIFTIFDKYNLTYRYENGVEMDVHSNMVEIYCEGTDGWLHIEQWNKPMKASSEELLKIPASEEVGVIRAVNEHVDFVMSIKNGRKPVHAAEDMHRTASVAHIGNIAMKLERKLQWNPKTEAFVNDDEANKMCSREERAPWTLNELINS